MPDKKTKRPLAKFALIGGLLAAAGSHLHHHGRGKERRALRPCAGPWTLS